MRFHCCRVEASSRNWVLLNRPCTSVRRGIKAGGSSICVRVRQVKGTSKTLGVCPLCGLHGPLTQQHVRFVPGLDDYRIMICQSCHAIVTRYEEELKKIR